MGLCRTGLMGQRINALCSKFFSCVSATESQCFCMQVILSVHQNRSFMELDCRGLMGLSEQMLRMSGIGGLQLGPIWWQGKANGKSVPPVDTPLPLQQVSILSHNNNNTNNINNNNNNNDDDNNIRIEVKTMMILIKNTKYWK